MQEVNVGRKRELREVHIGDLDRRVVSKEQDTTPSAICGTLRKIFESVTADISRL
jgi:hypothetical protein